MLRLIKDTLRTDHHVWISPFAPEACEARLRDRGLRGAGSWWSEAPLRGRSANGRVVAHVPRWVSNSFAPVLVGRLEPDGLGTALVAEVRPLKFATSFWAVWMLGATIGAVIAMAAAIAAHQWIGLVAPLFPAFGLGLIAISGAIASGERELLQRHVVDAIQGRNRSPDSGDFVG